MICLINCLFYNKKQQFGPFVYRLGHVVFILERGVRFPQGPPLMEHFVYLILTSNNKKYISYVGYTKNIKKRLELHNKGKGAKFTKNRSWKLIYLKKYPSKIIAMKEEYRLKKNYIKRKLIKEKYLKKIKNDI